MKPGRGEFQVTFDANGTMLRVETETATYEPKDFKDLSQEEMSPFNAAVTTLFFKSAGRAKCCVLQGGRWVCWTC